MWGTCVYELVAFQCFQLLTFSCIFKLEHLSIPSVIITMRDKLGIRITAKLVLIFICLLFSNIATAQQPYIPFKHYSTVQGLSQNHVIAILQDRQGFMWFGTLEGLNKFDGYEFTIFLHDSKDSTSLIQNFASYILEDHDGVIWVGTGGGLSRFNRATNNFTSYKHDPADNNSIRGGLINEILEDKKGNFWIALTTGYLDYFDRKQDKFTHYQLHKNLTDITSLIIDSDGNLWIGSRSGIAVMDESYKTIMQFRHEPNDRTSLSSSVVFDIFRDDRFHTLKEKA
jgi:ligand-binding sensor domain-containing protein